MTELFKILPLLQGEEEVDNATLKHVCTISQIQDDEFQTLKNNMLKLPHLTLIAFHEENAKYQRVMDDIIEVMSTSLENSLWQNQNICRLIEINTIRKAVTEARLLNKTEESEKQKQTETRIKREEELIKVAKQSYDKLIGKRDEIRQGFQICPHATTPVSALDHNKDIESMPRINLGTHDLYQPQRIDSIVKRNLSAATEPFNIAPPVPRVDGDRERNVMRLELLPSKPHAATPVMLMTEISKSVAVEVG